MTRREQLTALLSAFGDGSGHRFDEADRIVVEDIRAHFHVTGQEPAPADYDTDECVEEDIRAIEGILRRTR